MTNNSKEISHLTSPEFDGYVRNGHISKIILPIASLEQHGPHLPLSTDTTISEYIAKRIAERCPQACLMPAIPLGCSAEHLGFAGTISLEPETVSRLLLEVSASLRACGLRKLFIINGHGGNRSTLESAMASAKQSQPDMHLYTFTIIDVAKEKFAELRKSARRLIGHADEMETSMMLAIRPDVVDMSKAVMTEPNLPAPLSFEPEDLTGVSFSWTTKQLSETGVIGDPRHATAETGRNLIEFVVAKISAKINQL